MKKSYLLSGMIVLGIASIDAAQRLTEMQRYEIEDVQWGKIAQQKKQQMEQQIELRHPAIYKIIDPLVRKYKTYDKNGNPTYHDTSDWPAIFKILDELKGVISVNEYSFQTSGNPDEGYTFTPLLTIAVGENNLLVAKELLEKYHANPNTEDFEEKINKKPYKTGCTALTLASFNRDVPMVELLLKHGASPYIKWTYNNTNIIDMVKKDKQKILETRNITEAAKQPWLKKIDEILALLSQFK